MIACYGLQFVVVISLRPLSGMCFLLDTDEAGTKKGIFKPKRISRGAMFAGKLLARARPTKR